MQRSSILPVMESECLSQRCEVIFLAYTMVPILVPILQSHLAVPGKITFAHCCSLNLKQQ